MIIDFYTVILQVFVFVTISKFGALNCALIGLGRKMLSLLLSFILYNHTMNAIQMVGLSLSLLAMVANFYEKVRTYMYRHISEQNVHTLDIQSLLSSLNGGCNISNGYNLNISNYAIFRNYFSLKHKQT